MLGKQADVERSWSRVGGRGGNEGERESLLRCESNEEGVAPVSRADSLVALSTLRGRIDALGAPDAWPVEAPG